MIYRALFLTAVLFCGLLTSSPTQAITPYDDILVDQALKNLGQENFEEALDGLTLAWQKGTHTAEKAFYLGVVYRRLLNYPKAREFLEESLRLKPKNPEVQRLLADTLLTIDKPDLALPLLQEMEKAGYQPTQTAFLSGVAAAKLKRFDEAVDYFRKAQDDPTLGQEARLQMSMALAAQNRLKEARKALQEIITLAPQSDAAGVAQRYVSAVERRLKEIRPFRAYVSVGMDFDSNVTVQPGDPASAQLVTGQGDAVYTYNTGLEYNFFPGRPYGLLSQYAITQNFHPRLTKYDILSHTVGLVPMYQFTNSRLWFPFNFNYTDVENDKYYTGFTLTPTYLYLLTPKVGLELGLRWCRKYYWFPVSIPQDNRSAHNYGYSAGLYYFFKHKDQDGYLQARASYEHDYTYGGNWENSSYRLFFMALYPVTANFKVSTFIDLMLQPFDKEFYGGSPFQLYPKRRDKTFILGVNATYDIYKGLEFNLHYYLIRDDSNNPIFDYIRHILGGQIGFRY